MIVYSMFVQLRVTPEFCGEAEVALPRFIVPQVLEYLEKNGEVQNWAWVMENKNKFGEDTHPHYHLNIVGYFEDFNKQSFQAWFRRRPCLPKGNKCYALQVVGDPEDEDRWWRYLLKQYDPKLLNSGGLKNGNWNLENLPEHFKEDLEKMWYMAYDERQLQINKNCAARERALQNDSFRIRCFNSIADSFPGHGSEQIPDKLIYCAMVRYYQDNNKVPPFNTLMNMVFDFKCHFGMMTPEDYYDLRYDKIDSFLGN